MSNLRKIKEEFLYSIWKSDICNRNLKSSNGDTIEILNKGVHNNFEEGPDFKNAKVRINGITYLGDIEIDSRQSDWMHHGHNLNRKFNSVILHLYAIKEEKKLTLFSESGRKVESVNIADFLTDNVRNAVREAITAVSKDRMFFLPCDESNHTIYEREKLDYIKRLGLRRFDRKCSKFKDRLIEIKHEEHLRNSKITEPLLKYSPDENFYSSVIKKDDYKEEKFWLQLFYENLFEALGYTKNKDTFRQLALEVNLSFVKRFVPKDEFNQYAEFLFFKVAGFIPENVNETDTEAVNYINNLKNYWNIIGHSFDGVILNPEKWHYQQIRPQNYPTIRLAGGVRLIYELIYEDLIGSFFRIFEKNNNAHDLINGIKNLLIVKAGGFWKNRIFADKKVNLAIHYFIGNSRSEEIILNVVLPFMKTFYEVFNNHKMVQKVEMIYKTLSQNSENQLVKELCDSLHLHKYEHVCIFQQGLIELFRDYCSKKRCKECDIGKKVFN